MFNRHEMPVVYGSLLGDGSLVATGGGKSYRLQIDHHDKAYVLWKYKILQKHVRTEPKYQPGNDSWRFRTLTLPELQTLRKTFYRGNVKIVPASIRQIINPSILAVWYMDDGNLRREYGKIYGCNLNTQSFSRNENKNLKKLMQECFGLTCTLQLNHGKYRLYFGARSWRKFCKLVAPYVLPSLRYKLP